MQKILFLMLLTITGALSLHAEDWFLGGWACWPWYYCFDERNLPANTYGETAVRIVGGCFNNEPPPDNRSIWAWGGVYASDCSYSTHLDVRGIPFTDYQGMVAGTGTVSNNDAGGAAVYYMETSWACQETWGPCLDIPPAVPCAGPTDPP